MASEKAIDCRVVSRRSNRFRPNRDAVGWPARRLLLRVSGSSVVDTRMALLEAGRSMHMYGTARYIILDDVRQLPVKVTDIYRKITT